MNDESHSGKYYEPMYRFSLHINVHRDDVRANVIRRLASGTISTFPTLTEAVEAQNDFHSLLQGVTVGRYSSYGASYVTDTRDGLIHNTRHIA